MYILEYIVNRFLIDTRRIGQTFVCTADSLSGFPFSYCIKTKRYISRNKPIYSYNLKHKQVDINDIIN